MLVMCRFSLVEILLKQTAGNAGRGCTPYHAMIGGTCQDHALYNYCLTKAPEAVDNRDEVERHLPGRDLYLDTAYVFPISGQMSEAFRSMCRRSGSWVITAA